MPGLRRQIRAGSKDGHVRALGERTILRPHLRDTVEGRLQPVGLLGAPLALSTQLGGRAFSAARCSAVKPSDSVIELLAGIL
jgi:hypothetical protein